MTSRWPCGNQRDILFRQRPLGSSQALFNQSGQTVWQAQYDPFGAATVSPDSTLVNNLRLPGQYFDSETGLHYNWHRYYEPELGRYLTPDPIGLDGGINVFTYVQNNPINWNDPIGLQYADTLRWGTLGIGIALELCREHSLLVQ